MSEHNPSLERELFEACLDLPESRRYLGIVQVMRGNQQEALRFIRLASGSGQTDAMKFDDKDFDPLRKDVEFQQLVVEMDAQVAAAAEAEALAQEARY